jgi:beta-galactosidase
MKYFLFVFILLGLCCNNGMAQRISISLNEDWQFTKDTYSTTAQNPNTAKNIKWQNIQLPHTWNTTDVMDDEPGYYQAACWYKKKLYINENQESKDLFLFFEAANQVTEVFVNGKLAAKHKGGYTSFTVPLKGLLHFDGAENSNEIAIKVDNSFNENIPPLSADFTFYGGIYRDVYLVATNPVHFSVNDYSSSGVYLTTPVVTKEKAILTSKAIVSNTSNQPKKIIYTTLVVDASGNTVASKDSILTLKQNSETILHQSIDEIHNPNLWSPENPYLYRVLSQIKDAGTKQMEDEITNPLGFRWFSFNAAKGFFLNGKPYKLIGTSRHQDLQNVGNALPDEVAVNDMESIKKMGGNFVRVAHYPQDPALLQACDRLGILASVEIPVVNEITESENFYTNCVEMEKEMIKQNYNHPSIIIWCFMNEVLLKSHFTNDKERQKIYYANVAGLAQKLDSTARAEDKFRYTMIANHGDFDKYKNAGLTSIPMIVGWNLYSGWYSGTLNGFSDFLDRHRRELADKPMIVSEYGADADPRIKSFNPVRFDKSINYATAFHQYYFSEIMKRPFVAGGMIWNLSDFNSEVRGETMPHINSKGIQQWDRTPKAPYYFYQSQLIKNPFVKILSSNNEIRSGIADSSEQYCYQKLQVAANADSVELIVNENSLGYKKTATGIAEWNVPFINGNNKLESRIIVNGKTYHDNSNIYFSLHPYYFKNSLIAFNPINVLLGAKRYFTDEITKQVWIPDQPYRKGSFGSIGGKPFVLANNSRLPYGTDKNIFETDNDPVYQTQQVGIEEYRFDVLPGEYELTLCFAELQGGMVRGLAYNLTGNDRAEYSAERIFNVFVNNVLVLENMNIAAQYGIAKAVDKKIKICVNDNNGLRVIFKAVKGSAILNAIQLKKLY